MRRLFFIEALVAMVLVVPVLGQTGPDERSVHLTAVPLRVAIDSVMKWYTTSIVFMDRDVEGMKVTVECDECPLERALHLLLDRTPLSWVRSGDQYILLRRPAEAQGLRLSISGTVSDSLDDEPLAGVSVVLSSADSLAAPRPFRACTTNSFGFFSLRGVPPGSYDLHLASVGYRPTGRRVTVDASDVDAQELRMLPVEIALEEITVEGYRSSPAADQSVGHGVYLRSTPADYNYYYLDGARIYNPAHYGGVTTTIDEEMLNDVRMSAGGIPPAYGGHMGGIIDLSLRSGSFRRVGGTGSIGSLGGSFSVEGPLVPHVSFLATGRRGFPEPVIPTLESAAVRNRLGTTELSGKLLWRVSGGSQLSLNGFVSHDSYSSEATGAGTTLNSVMEWGNQLLNLRWISVAGPSLFLRAGASFTQYTTTLSNEYGGPVYATLPLSSNFTVGDVRLHADVESYLDEYHTLRGGMEFIRHRLDGYISPFATQTAQYAIHGYGSWESSFYLQDEWRLIPGVYARLGGRVSAYTAEGGNFSSIDPRLSLLVELGPTARLYGSLTTVNEFLHPYRSSGAFMLVPGIFWYAPTDRLRPMTSQQATVGGELDMDNARMQVSADAYYRVINNLHEFVIDSTTDVMASLGDVVRQGTSVAYGVRTSIQRRAGKLTGTLSYTLSWIDTKLSGLSGSQTLPNPLDRRHEVQLALAYGLDDHWTFGLICVAASLESAPAVTAARAGTSVGYDRIGAVAAMLPDLNSDRLPGFQRLEIQCGYRETIAGLPTRFSLRLLNSYGLLDPFRWTLTGQPDIRHQWAARLNAADLFPLYPTIEVSVRL
jgi:hypothetical protein